MCVLARNGGVGLVVSACRALLGTHDDLDRLSARRSLMGDEAPYRREQQALHALRHRVREPPLPGNMVLH